jgi:hypothetical protein
MTRDDTTRAHRKRAATAGSDKGKRSDYEDTPFGRRRISKLPKVVVKLISLIGIPVLFVYRRFRRSSTR